MGNKTAFDRKKLKALYATYSEDDHFNSGKFKPLTRNLTTGALLGRGHHCERCNAKMSQACYENFHYAYCSQWVTRKGLRVHCGERFAVHSDGCGKHPRVQGYNGPLYRAANGEAVELAEFDDPDPSNLNGEPEDDEDDMEAEMERVDEMAEDHFNKHGYVPVNFHNDYFAARTKEKAYAETEKIDAVEARGEVSGQPAQNGKNKGKTAAAKGKKKSATFADDVGQTGGPRVVSTARQRKSTYGNPLQQKDANLHLEKRSYAPKGAKPKLPMEIPRPAATKEVKESRADRAKKFAEDLIGKYSGTPE
jgi:hypothetical protein